MEKRQLTLKPYLIIDDGHGNKTPGKRSPLFEEPFTIAGKLYEVGEFVHENQINDAISKEVMRLAKLHRIDAVMLCPEFEDISLSERIKRESPIYNAAKATGKLPLLISIHANAHTSNPYGFLEWTGANGFETFYSPTKPKENQDFAKIIHKHCQKASGGRNRGVKTKPDFFIVRKSKSLSVIIEYGFMTNINELKMMLDPNYHYLMAQAIIDGVMEYMEFIKKGKV